MVLCACLCDGTMLSSCCCVLLSNHIPTGSLAEVSGMLFMREYSCQQYSPKQLEAGLDIVAIFVLYVSWEVHWLRILCNAYVIKSLSTPLHLSYR